MHSDYNYSALLLMAHNEGFIGSGLSVDDDHIDEVAIYIDNQPTPCCFQKMVTGAQIKIDGKSNYISPVIPALSKTTVNLLPTFQ